MTLDLLLIIMMSMGIGICIGLGIGAYMQYWLDKRHEKGRYFDLD